MTASPRKSKQQLAAEARVRGLLKERDTLGSAEADRLQRQRQRAANERVRARTAAVVAARLQGRQLPLLDLLPFEESPLTTDLHSAVNVAHPGAVMPGSASEGEGGASFHVPEISPAVFAGGAGPVGSSRAGAAPGVRTTPVTPYRSEPHA